MNTDNKPKANEATKELVDAIFSDVNERIKDNKIVAVFMGETGLTKVKNDKLVPYDKKYDVIWQTLMSVVEKIENIVYTTTEHDFTGGDEDDIREVDVYFSILIEGSMCTINYDITPQFFGTHENFLELYDCRKYTNGSTKLENTFLAVVAFIKWYNKSTAIQQATT